MKNGSTGLFNTLTLVFLLLTLFVFICALGIFAHIIQPPGIVAPKTPNVPKLLPTIAPSGMLLELPDGTRLRIGAETQFDMYTDGESA